MCKMSTGVVAFSVAGLVGLACSDQSGLNSLGGGAENGGGAKGGQAGSAVGAGIAGVSGGTTGPGPVGAGGTSGTGGTTGSGGTTGAGGCPLLYCPAMACLGGTQPNPQPCGCPICEPNPDGGTGGGAGGAIGAGGSAGGATSTGGTTGTGGRDGGVCLALPCAPPICPGRIQPSPEPCGCPICAADAGVPTDGGKKDAAPICPPMDCGGSTCGGVYLPNPDPCGCPTCAPPDAGVAKDAGRADSRPVCLPVACPAIACVGGMHPNPDPCGCPICGPTPDAGAAKDATPPTACPMLASLNSTDAAHVGYTAARVLLTCAYAGGGGVCVSNDPTACPGFGSVGGDSVSCSNTCTADEYGLGYGGVGPLAAPPSIDLPVGCRLGEPTPGGVAFYCCPCGM
jgi:hypothetical protein